MKNVKKKGSKSRDISKVHVIEPQIEKGFTKRKTIRAKEDKKYMIKTKEKIM